MEPVRSLHDLLDLQDVDSQIDRLIDQRQNLPELSQLPRFTRGDGQDHR